MTVLGLATGVLALVPLRATDLPTQNLPVYGGMGGTAFTRSCGAGRVLSGLRLRTGMQVDAVGLLCRPLLTGGTLGSETTVGTLVGGSGGTTEALSCGPTRAVVGARIYHGTWIDGVLLECRFWDAATRSVTGDVRVTAIGGRSTGANKGDERCESSRQPAVGIRGRAASLVDAIGFVCDEP